MCIQTCGLTLKHLSRYTAVDECSKNEACVLGSYHALFWHCSLDLATDHLSKRRAVLWGSEAPLGLCSAGLGGGNPRRLASSLVHIHVQTVPLPHCTLENKHTVSFTV